MKVTHCSGSEIGKRDHWTKKNGYEDFRRPGIDIGNAASQKKKKKKKII